jgi:hypothetical protein
MNGRTRFVYIRSIRTTSCIYEICTGYSVIKVGRVKPESHKAYKLGYRFKTFDAARAMADANPNEVGPEFTGRTSGAWSMMPGIELKIA